jgi:hypothetical protein
MTTEQANHIIQLLSGKGVHFESGLTDDEILQAEAKFNFRFPPDLKLFLQTALPINDRFVDWRLGLESKEEADKITERFNWPLEGMLFDIDKNNFWINNWGERPGDYTERVIIAKKHYETYPKLIPIYSHRYISERPNESGNPIFSVHQMDIIYYGINLEHYFANEFRYTESGDYELEEYPEKKIEFWSERAEDEDVYS